MRCAPLNVGYAQLVVRTGCPLFTPRLPPVESAQCRAAAAAVDASSSHVFYAQWMNGGRAPVEDDAHTGSGGLSVGLHPSGRGGSVAGTGVKCTGSDRVCWSGLAELGCCAARRRLSHFSSRTFFSFFFLYLYYFQVRISVSCAACLY